MSSLRARLLKVLKRVDNTTFNISPQPAGIRYLNDDAGHVLAIFTTEMNPNQPEPLRPGTVLVDDDGDAMAVLTSVNDAETNTQNQLAVKTRAQLFNAVSWDAERNNITATILASAARTANTNSADQVNYNHRGIHIIYDVTAVSGTTPTLTPRLQTKDPVSAKYSSMTSQTALTAVGTPHYIFYPTAGGVAGDVTAFNNGVLPRTFRTSDIIGGTTPSFTYSVGALLVL